MTPADARCSLHPAFAALGTCRRCGRFACANCFRPQSGLCVECEAREGGPETPPPWEKRSELGLVQGYLQTVRDGALQPVRFWSSFPGEGPMGDAFFFGWLTTALSALPTGLLASVNLSSSVALLKGMPNLPPVASRILQFMEDSPLRFGALMAAYMIVIYPVGLIIGAGFMHLMLLLWGAAGRGFQATLRVQCYAHFPQLIAWVPLVGAFAGFWQLVLFGIGASKVHRASPGRVVGAILTPLILVALCGCGLAILIPVMMKGALGR
ncbi:MAG: Yip1 family protein [Myxococcota bacterium]